MDKDAESTDCIPISTETQANQGLEASEAATTYKEYLNHTVNPPVQPNGGEVFLFDLGPDETRWENNKKKLRSVHICI